MHEEVLRADRLKEELVEEATSAQFWWILNKENKSGQRMEVRTLLQRTRSKEFRTTRIPSGAVWLCLMVLASVRSRKQSESVWRRSALWKRSASAGGLEQGACEQLGLGLKYFMDVSSFLAHLICSLVRTPGFLIRCEQATSSRGAENRRIVVREFSHCKNKHGAINLTCNSFNEHF